MSHADKSDAGAPRILSRKQGRDLYFFMKEICSRDESGYAVYAINPATGQPWKDIEVSHAFGQMHPEIGRDCISTVRNIRREEWGNLRDFRHKKEVDPGPAPEPPFDNAAIQSLRKALSELEGKVSQTANSERSMTNLGLARVERRVEDLGGALHTRLDDHRDQILAGERETKSLRNGLDLALAEIKRKESEFAKAMNRISGYEKSLADALAQVSTLSANLRAAERLAQSRDKRMQDIETDLGAVKLSLKYRKEAEPA